MSPIIKMSAEMKNNKQAIKISGRLSKLLQGMRKSFMEIVNQLKLVDIIREVE